jgi:hypothetical protein
MMMKDKIDQFQTNHEEREQQDSQEAIPPIVLPPSQPIKSNHLDGTIVKKREKITFYLTTEQVDKLEDLAYQHKIIKGRRINRNTIVRYLIEHCTLEWLEDL